MQFARIIHFKSFVVNGVPKHPYFVIHAQKNLSNIYTHTKFPLQWVIGIGIGLSLFPWILLIHILFHFHKKICIQEPFILKYVFFTSKLFSSNNDSCHPMKGKFCASYNKFIGNNTFLSKITDTDITEPVSINWSLLHLAIFWLQNLGNKGSKLTVMDM